MKPITVEEAWKKWADSETGKACSDLDAYESDMGVKNDGWDDVMDWAKQADAERSLIYRLRAAFVAGWIAKEEGKAIDNV